MKQGIIIVLVGFAIILAGWFYWYEMRPAQIRKDCLAKAEQEFEEDGTFKPGKFVDELTGEKQDKIKSSYENCLRGAGL